MAITGVSSISGQQIIAAGALSAASAGTALFDENGNAITSYLTAVPEGYATTAEVANKLDASAVNTAFFPFHGFLVSGIDNKPIFARTAASAGYAKFDINGTDLTSYLREVPTGTMNETAFRYDSDNLIKSYNGSAFATTLPASADATLDRVYRSGDVWDTVTGKQDITGMTAYANSANVTGTAQYGLTTAGWSEITGGGEVPEGVLVESGLEYDANNKISGYSGSAFAAGTELEFEYDAADNISAINNSAISTTPSQALYAQNPLYFSATGASSYIGIQPSAQYNETLLWSGSASTGTLNFSEPLTSFNEFKFYVYIPERGTNQVLIYYDAVNTVNPGFLQLTMPTFTTGSVISAWWQGIYSINGTIDTATYKAFSIYANGQYYKQCSTTACGTNDSKMVIKKVIGIGRKEI